jgi:hypothetical protein
MRARIAFRRAAKGDPEARAAVARAYSYVADPEAVEQALDGYGGSLGDLAGWLRYLRDHPVTTSPLATATVDHAAWDRATVGSPIPRKPRSGVSQEEPEAERPAPAEPEVTERSLDTATQVEPEELTDPKESGTVPGAPTPEPQKAPPPARTPTPPAAGTTPTKRVEVRAVVTKPARPKTGTGPAKSSLPSGAHGHLIGAVLSVAPKWSWQIYDCIHLEVGDGALTVFSRQDAAAVWVSLAAETVGRATLAIPRQGVVQLRCVRGAGPITLELFEDRLVARRDGEPIVAPARPGAIPRIPEIAVRGGVVLAREALVAALDAEAEEVRLEYCNRRLLVGGQAVSLVYAPSTSFEAGLDPKLLSNALRRGDATVTLEFGKPADPVIITSGCLVAAIAPRSMEPLL